MILGVDGVPDFDALHSRKHDDEVQLYAFDNRSLTIRAHDLSRIRVGKRAQPLLVCHRMALLFC